MVKHLISVCIFCFICATHSPCASHAEVRNETTARNGTDRFPDFGNPPLGQNEEVPLQETFKTKLNKSERLTPSDVDSNNKNYSNIPVINLVKRSDNNVNGTKINEAADDKSDLQSESYIKKIFAEYGDGDTMTMDGFERLMRHLDTVYGIEASLFPIHHNTSLPVESKDKIHTVNDSPNITCLSHEELVSSVNNSIKGSSNKIDSITFQKTCPKLLYNFIMGGCVEKHSSHIHVIEPDLFNESPNPMIWVYSILAVVLISACGVLGLAVIPIMQKKFYQPMLQFFVALAVGTLAGDALLHLLPHAMTSHGHDLEHEAHVHAHTSENSHDENTWKGFVAMLGLIFFFFMERIILIIAKWRKAKQLRQIESSKIKVKQMGDEPTSGEKQCMNKYSSFPLCYKEIVNRTPNHGKIMEDTTDLDNTATTILDDFESNDVQNTKKPRSNYIILKGGKGSKPEYNGDISKNDKAYTEMKRLLSADGDKVQVQGLETKQADCPSDISRTCSEINKMLYNSDDSEKYNSDYTVILREHENKHHGHSHTHGHVHAAPKTMSSVAWMVIMGDGLHNFTDGMAIGAAFAGGVAGGFSTTVAVFCHELPHELGDFAMLLKAGMSMKQALYYNLLSSVLCLLGNICGVILGNTPYASSWVFAMAAGMFIYIALVDMMPELSSAHEDEGNVIQCFLHFGGLLLGFFIMTLIAVYEHDLKHIFHDTE